MRTRAGALLTGLALVAALAGVAGTPASGQTTPSQQVFSGFGTGTVLGLNAVQAGNGVVANTQVARSAGAVSSQGLTVGGVDELGQNINPALGTGKNAYGRGAGAEVGLLTATPQQTEDINQIILTQLAEAAAPPPTGLIEEQIALDLRPLLFAPTAYGGAQAIYDPNTCTIGRPITFGRGFVENAQVLPSSPTAALATTNNTVDALTESRTVTYLIPNGDGTFGMVAETRLLIAPITLLAGSATPITIEIGGPLIMRTIATGKPGGARVEYPGTPVLTIRLAGVAVPPTPISLQNLFGQNGLVLDLSPVANLTAGSRPHAIGGAPTSAPVIAADGTSASAAVDAVRLSLLNLPGLGVLDLRVGHMEGGAQVPAGGILCNIPVSKSSSPDPIPVGEDFTITIRIPSSTELFQQLFGCDLVDISAVDVHVVESGNVSFTLTGANLGGTITNGDTVSWANLGTYRIGDPPIELQVTGHISGSSGAGVITDTVTVSATLGNCRGEATGARLTGQDIVGSAVQGGRVTGTRVLRTEVTRVGALAATGGDQRLLLAGGVLLLGALGVYRRLRRPAEAKSTSTS